MTRATKQAIKKVKYEPVLLPHNLSVEEIRKVIDSIEYEGTSYFDRKFYAYHPLTVEQVRENRQVLAKFILKHGDKFDMRVLHALKVRSHGNRHSRINMDDVDEPETPNQVLTCGTTHCIAGWTVATCENRKDILRLAMTVSEEGYLDQLQVASVLLSVPLEIFYKTTSQGTEILKEWRKGNPTPKKFLKTS